MPKIELTDWSNYVSAILEILDQINTARDG